MPTGRISQTLILQDGRQLGFAEYGAPTGCPVFHFHGSASSRLERPSSEGMLLQMDIRFISVDRPGHGLSHFQPNRRLLDWPQDIRQLANRLRLQEFYVTGYSAGGPHALACAHQLPGQVIAGAVMGCVAPMSRPGAYQGLPLSNQILARSARSFPWFTKLIRRIMRGMLMDDAKQASRRLMSSIPDVDKAVLYTSPHAELFVSSVREGLRPGSQGVAQDDMLVNQEWGFDLTDVRPRIDIWHGEADVNVPIHAAAYLRDQLPHTRVTTLPGEGHFFLLKRWEEVLSALVPDNQE